MGLTTTDVYNKIKEHFSAPGAVFAMEEYEKKSDFTGAILTGERCVYRGGGDPHSPIRCAFGVVIPDDEYNPSMENRLAADLLYEGCFPGLLDDNDPRVFQFVIDCQKIHDHCARDGKSLDEMLEMITNRYHDDSAYVPEW